MEIETQVQAQDWTSSDSACMSADVRLLANSLAKAKRHFGKTGKSATNNHTKYSYAKIEDIYNAVESSLLDEDVIIWHGNYFKDDKEVLITRFIHTLSGQWMQDIRYIESEKPGNQAKGAANTYMRKYAVLCMCAIATEDDDGQHEQEYIKKNSPHFTVSTSQSSMIKAAIKKHPDGINVYKELLSDFGISSVEELQAKDFERVMDIIKEGISHDS
jgi:hypothetical protein